MTFRIDKGVEFAKQNIEKALVAAKELGFEYLYRVLKRELQKFKDVTKTGDLIRYYEKFSDGTHHYAIDFLTLSQLSDECFYPNEKLAMVLKERYPDEVYHITNPERDFEIGQAYSNDFLSVVLGGNYMSSFRFTRDEDFSYIMINELISDVNDWQEEENILLFVPPHRFYSTENDVIRLARRIEQKRILVFDKLSSYGFTFFGQYRLIGIVDNKLKFKRIEAYDGLIRGERKSKPEKEQIKSFLEKGIDPTIALTDIVTQKANEYRIDFNVKKIIDNKTDKPVFLVTFPYGFYPISKSYDSFCLAVGEFSSYGRNTIKNSNCSIFLSSNRYGNFKERYYGWELFEKEIDSYSKVNYENLKKMSIDESKGCELEINLKNNLIYESSYKKFIIEALKVDIKVISNDLDTKEQMAEMPQIDLITNSYYERLEIDSPCFIVGTNIGQKFIEKSYDAFVSLGGLSFSHDLVFIDLSRMDSKYVFYKERVFLILGFGFVYWLSKLFKDIFVQYVPAISINTALNDSRDNFFGEKINPLVAEIEYRKAVKMNGKHFLDLFKSNEHKITLITGNGISIPFGTETWEDMSDNILKQLVPFYIKNMDDIKSFFGKSSLFTTDFALETLEYYKQDDLYNRALMFSVYRRYSSNIFKEETAVKAIANIKNLYRRNVEIITYNYDTFIEDVSKNVMNNNLIPVNTLKSGQLLENEILHVHGFFEENGNAKDIVLTRTQYREAYEAKKRKEGINYLADALKNNLCLFIGSSMTDMYQMALIDEVRKKANNEGFVYALMPICKLDDKAVVTVYNYFLRKKIYIIPFKDFDTLSNSINQLFGLVPFNEETDC